MNAAVLQTVAELIPDIAPITVTPGESVSSSDSEAPAQFEAIVYEGLGDLPLFNPDNDHDPLPPAVAFLRAAIEDASALLFSTPEYAGAMPGALKNLLEWTVGGVEITDKPTGWINPSTGPTGASGTYQSLDIVLTYTDARLVPAACVTHPVPRSLVVDGRVEDAAAHEAIRGAVAALAAAADAR